MTRKVCFNDAQGFKMILVADSADIDEVISAQVPDGAEIYQTSDDVDMSDPFYMARKATETELTFDLVKAKAIGHVKRREKRDKLFGPYDEIIAKQIPGNDAAAAEIARSQIRSDDTVIQSTIDSAPDIESIRAVLGAYGAI